MVLLDRDSHRIHRFGSWRFIPSSIDCVCVLEIPVPCKRTLQGIRSNRLELRDMKKKTFKKFRSSSDDKKLEEYNSYRPDYRYVITYYRLDSRHAFTTHITGMLVTCHHHPHFAPGMCFYFWSPANAIHTQRSAGFCNLIAVFYVLVHPTFANLWQSCRIAALLFISFLVFLFRSITFYCKCSAFTGPFSSSILSTSTLSTCHLPVW